MRQHIRPVIIAALVFIFACLLGGCSTQPVTQMTIEHGFSGQRVMICTLKNGGLDQIAGGEEALDALLRQSCPKQLSWEKAGQGDGAVYSFTLSFESEQEYREKVEDLLGRECYLLYARPSGVFARGVRLEEDFSSGDLMSWLDQTLVDQQLCDGKPGLFSEGEAQVTVEGQVFSSPGQLEVREFDYLPVNKVTVFTRLLDNDRFERTIAISIPQSTLEQSGESLEPYLQQRIPQGGTGEWSETASGKTFSISFMASTNDSLAAQTAQALDSASSQSVMEQQKDTLFNSQVAFTERLNFSSFPSNRYGKTFVEYRFASDSTSGVSEAQLFQSGRWMTVDGYLDSEGFLFQQDSCLMQVRLQSQNEYSVESVAIATKRMSQGSFQREIQLKFAGETGQRGAQTACRYFEGLNIDGLSAAAEGTHCTLSLQGAPSELSASLTRLLGPGNEITLSKQDGFQLYHSTLVHDRMDLQSFLHQIGYGGPVSYTYIGDSPVSSLDEEGNQISQAVRVDPQTVTRQLPQDGKASLTAVVQWANPWFVLMLGGAALLFLAAVAAVLLLAHRHTVRKRESERVCLPGAFPLSRQRCSSCGARLYQGMLFCTKCGQPIVWENHQAEKPKKTRKKRGGSPS